MRMVELLGDLRERISSHAIKLTTAVRVVKFLFLCFS